MGKQKGSKKKTPAQANKINNELGNRTASIDSTYEASGVSYLDGTEKDSEFWSGEEKVRPKKMRYKIEDWCRKNLVPTLICSAITAVIGFVVTNVILLKIDVRIIEEKIAIIENDIKSIEEDYISKQLLEIQVESLKASLENSKNLDIKEIESKILLIEQQIEFLKDDIKSLDKQNEKASK